MVKGMINEVLEIKLIVEHGTECEPFSPAGEDT